MESICEVVMENKIFKVDYISNGKWDFDMNWFLGFWNEEGEWIYIVQFTSWEVSFWKQLVKDAWHVAMVLDLWNIGLYMFFTSISPFFMCSIHLQIEKKSSRVTRACIDLLLPKTCKNLALAYNKTWDDGRREIIGLYSPKNYEKTTTSNYL